jgi:hypothetical protein
MGGLTCNPQEITHDFFANIFLTAGSAYLGWHITNHNGRIFWGEGHSSRSWLSFTLAAKHTLHLLLPPGAQIWFPTIAYAIILFKHLFSWSFHIDSTKQSHYSTNGAG